MEFAGIKSAGKPMKDECAAVKLAPKELIARNVHHGVLEGLILDFPDDHHFTLRDCWINGERFDPEDLSSCGNIVGARRKNRVFKHGWRDSNPQPPVP